MTVYTGDLLTASAASVAGKPTPSRTWQWLRNGTAISGATSSTYTVAEADLGANLSVKQIETNIAGSDDANSLTVGPVATFSPSVLFASDEPGVWYDPSDLDTLFADTAGTTPATVGGTLALMLDKSQGLTLGSELIDANNWTTSSGVTVSEGAISFSGTQTQNSTATQNVLTAGRSYEISFRVTGYAQGLLSLTFGGTLAYGAKISANGTYTRVGVASSSSVFNFQDRETTALIATIDNISVRELPGNHATQATAASRPTLRQSGDLYYLEFDGVDDFMVTPTITPGTDKVQVFAGVRKPSGATSILVESSDNIGTNNGAFHVASIAASTANQFTSRGTSSQAATANGPASPVSLVLTGIGDISGDTATLRVDGTQAVQNTVDQGTGNYLAYPMYIGRRGGTSFPFNGHIYSLITRFGDNLEANLINQSETYVAGKTGVEL